MKKMLKLATNCGFHSRGYGKNNGNIQGFKFDTHMKFSKESYEFPLNLVCLPSGVEGRSCCLRVDGKR